MRRLRFIVNFPFPGPPSASAIWQQALPGETPDDAISTSTGWPGFSLTGGSIHNIALNAAFLAARAGRPVTMPMLLAAARTELRKLDKPINEAEFR